MMTPRSALIYAEHRSKSNEPMKSSRRSGGPPHQELTCELAGTSRPCPLKGGEAASLKNSEVEPHAHVPEGDLAQLIASDQRDVGPEVPAAIHAEKDVGVEGGGAVGSEFADRGVARVALQLDRRRRRPDHAQLAADTVVVGIGVEIEAGDLHVLELGVVKAEAAVEARRGRERVRIADTDAPLHHVEITFDGVDAIADLEVLTVRRIRAEQVHVVPELVRAADEGAGAGVGLEIERAVDARECPGLLHVVDEAGDEAALEVIKAEILCPRSRRRAQRDCHGKCEHIVTSGHTFTPAWKLAHTAGHHGRDCARRAVSTLPLYARIPRSSVPPAPVPSWGNPVNRAEVEKSPIAAKFLKTFVS